jgi:alginate O-acetyltransferase complex protein AlgI
MIFNSFTYLIFLAVAVCVYWALPRTPRLVFMLACNLLFYGFWRFDYIAVIVASASSDFVSGVMIGRSVTRRGRLLWLVFSLTINFGMLFYFKYAMFILDNVNGIAHWLGQDDVAKTWHVLLPIGISFYTFHTVSYVVDVYRGRVAPVREPLLYAIFVSFFPQLVAGPILRAAEVIPQLARRPAFALDNVTQGIWLILNGLFLKCVLADNIGDLVDQGFGAPTSTLSALDVWVLAFTFGFQIYFDFAAYSQIAMGSAQLLGIHFPRNFYFPYLAVSPRDFWRRWHISLSSWIRDYLYLPLCGVRPHDKSQGGLVPDAGHVGELRRDLALFGTWAAMGLWHGANWTFVAWGLWHATLIFIQRLIDRIHPFRKAHRLRSIIGWIVTVPAIMLGWIFFRSASLGQAIDLLAKVVQPAGYLSLAGLRSGYLWSALPINIEPMTYLAAGGLLIGTVVVHFFQRSVWPRLARYSVVGIPPALIYGALVSAAVFIYLRPARQFIYFQF